MPKILLVRHGQTSYNLEKRYQGQRDVPMTPFGRDQAKATAVRLAGERLDRVYASDLGRAMETAAAIATAQGLPVLREPRLRELDFGTWEGLTHEEIRRRDPDTLRRWLSDPKRTVPRGGESLEHLCGRVALLLDELRILPEAETILLVSHGGTLRCLLCVALDIDGGRTWQLRIDSCSLSEIYLYEQGAILNHWNDGTHLEEDGGASAGEQTGELSIKPGS